MFRVNEMVIFLGSQHRACASWRCDECCGTGGPEWFWDWREDGIFRGGCFVEDGVIEFSGPFYHVQGEPADFPFGFVRGGLVPMILRTARTEFDNVFVGLQLVF